MAANDALDPPEVANCFSVDVESFAESNVQSFSIPAKHLDHRRQSREIEINMDFILGLLAEHGVKATFFFLGRIARDIPRLVRRVAQENHEIACHSLNHFRLYDFAPEVFAEELREAKGLLEDASGQQVCGFRAPDFSITRKSAWALDALQQAGFLYDSSVYPFGGHDVYGVAGASPQIYRLPNGLIEWPLATIPIFKRRVPFGGGGYFRLYPFRFTEYCFSRINRQGRPCMFYIHPYEIGPAIERIPGLSHLRQFRHYFQCGASDRITRLLNKFHFSPALATLRRMGYLTEIISGRENTNV